MKPSSIATKISFLLLTFALFNPLTAFANLNASGAPPALPDWLEFSLAQQTILSDIYHNSIADSIFVRVKSNGSFYPPVQHITRTVNAKAEIEDPRLSKEILNSLGIDTTAASTIRLSKGNFKAGEKSNLPGFYEEYYSTVEKETYVTCIAYVKDGEKLQIVFTEASRGSLSKCSPELIALTKSASFHK